MYFLPKEIIIIIKEFSMPLTKWDWKKGSIHSNIIKLKLKEINYRYFSNYQMTFSGFLIYNNTLKSNNKHIEFNNLKEEIIEHIEKQFILQGKYL
jgi:hypothetical protein